MDFFSFSLLHLTADERLKYIQQADIIGDDALLSPLEFCLLCAEPRSEGV